MLNVTRTVLNGDALKQLGITEEDIEPHIQHTIAFNGNAKVYNILSEIILETSLVRMTVADTAMILSGSRYEWRWLRDRLLAEGTLAAQIAQHLEAALPQVFTNNS